MYGSHDTFLLLKRQRTGLRLLWSSFKHMYWDCMLPQQTFCFRIRIGPVLELFSIKTCMMKPKRNEETHQMLSLGNYKPIYNIRTVLSPCFQIFLYCYFRFLPFYFHKILSFMFYSNLVGPVNIISRKIHVLLQAMS